MNATAANVCSQIAGVACFDMYSCCSEGEIESLLEVNEARTEAQCVDDVTRLCSQRTAEVDASISKGRATFDGSAMNSCLDALIAPSGQCSTEDMVLPWAAACADSAWVGLVAAGGSCDFAYECAGGLDSTCTAQKCVERPGNGSSCQQEPCGIGLFCNPSEVCQTLGGAGSACAGDFQCGSGLFCDTTQPAPVCTAQHGPGEACTSNDACTSEECLPGTCSGAIAESCFEDAQCEGFCANSPNVACTQDSQCGEGTCSLSHEPCFDDPECPGVGSGSGSGSGSAGSGSDTCVFPSKCTPGTCGGSIVCADQIVIVNYCTEALDSIPTPPQ